MKAVSRKKHFTERSPDTFRVGGIAVIREPKIDTTEPFMRAFKGTSLQHQVRFRSAGEEKGMAVNLLSARETSSVLSSSGCDRQVIHEAIFDNVMSLRRRLSEVALSRVDIFRTGKELPVSLVALFDEQTEEFLRLERANILEAISDATGQEHYWSRQDTPHISFGKVAAKVAGTHSELLKEIAQSALPLHVNLKKARILDIANK